MKIFDALIKPIVLYGFAIWGLVLNTQSTECFQLRGSKLSCSIVLSNAKRLSPSISCNQSSRHNPVCLKTAFRFKIYLHKIQYMAYSSLGHMRYPFLMLLALQEDFLHWVNRVNVLVDYLKHNHCSKQFVFQLTTYLPTRSPWTSLPTFSLQRRKLIIRSRGGIFKSFTNISWT